jgi:hypothetical protein
MDLVVYGTWIGNQVIEAHNKAVSSIYVCQCDELPTLWCYRTEVTVCYVTNVENAQMPRLQR